MSTEPSNDEWRIQGQERYLAHAELTWQRWLQKRPDWDHDHCEFCWAKFAEYEAPDTFNEGYATADGQEWLCATCARDYAVRFDFTLIGGPN